MTMAGLAAFAAGCSPNLSAPATAEKAPPEYPVKITQFYASPPNPSLGERTLVCYGVENAVSVTLDPPDERVWPAPSRCFAVTPKKAVTYTLTAERRGERDIRTLTIVPGPPQVRILGVTVSALEVGAGDSVALCYDTRNAVSVTVTPGPWRDTESTRHACLVVAPTQQATYTITATGADGGTDTEQVTIKVK
jgi:hypothetical protein